MVLVSAARPTFAWVTLVVVAMATTPASAATSKLEPAKDNTLFESALGSVSNGVGEYLFVGQTLQPRKQRAVMAFDIRAALPIGAVIESAQLTLFLSKTISGAQPVSLHPLLADWGEGKSNAANQEGIGAPAQTSDATWLHTFFDTGAWSTPGGDFEPTASATTSVNQVGFYTWGSNAAMVADVQSWLDTPSMSFGWLVLGNESAVATSKRFNSVQHLSGLHPFMDLTYHTRTPGDASDDAIVDGADYTLWADNYLQTGRTFSEGDFSGDNLVDGADYTLWADNYAPGPALATAVVPEPANWVLLASGGMLLPLLARRRLRL